MRKKISLLIIEDRSDDVDLLVLKLGEAGYRVEYVRVENAVEMKEALARRKDWDLVLSDYELPSFSAPLALTILQQTGLDIPFIIVSGTIGEERAVSTMRAGARDFILKSDLTRLIPVIERELREAETRRLKRKVDLAYKSSEQRYRQIVDTAREGIWLINGEGLTTFTNKAMASMLGVYEQELMGQSILNYLLDTPYLHCKDFVERIRSTPSGQYDLRFKRKDGSDFSAVVSVTALTEGDQFSGALLMITDMTDRQFLAEAGLILSSSLDFSRTLQSVANLATSRLADWCQIHVVEPGTKAPKSIAISHPDPSKQEVAREYQKKFPIDWNADRGIPQVIRSGKSELYPFITREMLKAAARAPGHLEIMESLGMKSVMIVPILTRSRILGAITFVSAERERIYTEGDLALAEDLARRAGLAIDNAMLFSELQAANKAKDQFLATLSHELRTPLNVILGWIAMLKNDQLDESTFQQALETLDRNAKTQKDLIDDLLDVSRIITGKLTLDPHPMTLNALVESALSSVSLKVQNRRIQLETDLSKTPVLIFGDQTRLNQVLLNVLDNAIKFTPTGGKISVTLTKEGGRAIIRVTDTGKGIEPSFVPHVFDALRQEDMGTTRTHGGLGLGLAISSHIIENHNGKISAQSPGRDQGTTITISLPLLEKEPITPSHEVREDQTLNLKDIKVLVVDDAPDVLALITFWLKRRGARVVSVGSAKEAFQALKEFKPDVLLSDIGMPDEDGYALINKIRNLRPEDGGQVRAAALTAYARDEEKKQALKAGFHMHISKPVSDKYLTEAVANLAQRIH